MTPVQIRMACAGLGWSWEKLTKSADVSRDTVARFLRGVELKESTTGNIRAALEKAGVVFIGDDGVRIRKKSKR